jgi:hypothetical protein
LSNSTSDPAEALPRRIAPLAALLLALLAFLTLPASPAHGWDEAMHLELPAARMLVAMQQGAWSAWADAFLDCSQYPPGWPLVLSLWQGLCGIGETSARALGCLSLGLLAHAVYLVALAAARDARVAWLGFSIVALSPLCWAYGSTLFLEVPFAAAAAFTLHAWLVRADRPHGALRAGAWFTCAFFIKFNPSLQVHPMKLIMWISFADSALANVVLISYSVCELHLYELFASTVMFSSTIEDQYRALWILQASKNILAVFLTLLIFLMNTCLAIDMIMMIRYPFSNKAKSIPVYLIYSFSIALGLTISAFCTLQYKEFSDGDKWPVPAKYT